MLGISSPYLAVQTGSALSYGGNQTLSDNNTIKKCGCGIVAALDLVIYLNAKCRGSEKKAADRQQIPLSSYNRYLHILSRKYFPLIPHFGMNGLVLIAGLNRLFHSLSLPFKAEWKVSEIKMEDRIAEMLTRDIPVILAIGPNFPTVWQQNRLTLYKKSAIEDYRKYSAAKAHFVTVTGIDEKWMRISSWGKELYISRAEYHRYVEAHSTPILSNIVYIHTTAEHDRPKPEGKNSYA